MGAAVEHYCARLTENAKKDKVHTADFNWQIREAMAAALGR